MLLPDINHGTVTAYSKHGCRCFPCRQADHKFRTKWYAERNQGIKRIVDSAPAVEHYLKWRELTGQGQRVFARLAGVGARTIFGIVNENKPNIKAATLAAILAVPLDPAPVPDMDEVPSLVYRRKVEALAAIGYGFNEQSRRLGLHESNLRASITRPNLHRETASRIDGLYDELHMRPVSGYHSADQARRRAAALGFLPPLAWVDITDPNETPTKTTATRKPRRSEYDEAVVLRVVAGEHLPLTPAERTEVVTRLRARGYSYTEVERLTGITKIDRHVKKAAA